jgi:hypothetical protein
MLVFRKNSFPVVKVFHTRTSGPAVGDAEQGQRDIV